MCLHVNSNVIYLLFSKERSRGAEHFYFSDGIPDSVEKPTHKSNGAVLIECVILRNIMKLAAEEETQTVFHNRKAAIPIRITAKELGRHQPATTFKTNNSTCGGILNVTMRQKRSKHYDTKIWCFHDMH